MKKCVTCNRDCSCEPSRDTGPAVYKTQASDGRCIHCNMRAMATIRLGHVGGAMIVRVCRECARVVRKRLLDIAKGK